MPAVGKRRSARAYIKLALWSGATVAVAYCSLAMSVANIAHMGNPELALRFNPSHPIALARLAQANLKETPTKQGLAKAAALASRSLAAQAINSDATLALAFAREAQGDTVAARRLVELASRMSRREIAAQLWLIEDRIARNDVTGAVAHYDIVLRSSVESQDLLLPILTAALDDQKIRAALIPYLRQRVPWAGAFLAYATQSSKDAGVLAEMIIESGKLPSDEESKLVESRLVARMYEAGQWNQLERFYRTLPGADPELLQSPRISEASVDPRFPPITWDMGQGSETAVSVEEAADKKAPLNFRIFADPGERTTVLRKLLLLSPGRHAIVIDQQPISGADGASVDWSISCGKEKAVWQRAGLDPVKADFEIPNGCGGAILSLSVSGGNSQDGFELLIKSIALSRAAQVRPPA